jgi:anti-sigma factor RsiW
MTQLSDEFLLAYLDGQLERSQSAEVSQLAAANAEVSRRVARLKRTQAQLIESFSAFAREEITLPKSAFPSEESQARPSQAAKAARAVKGLSQTLASAAPAQKEPDAVRKMLFVLAVFAGGVLGGYGATFVRSSPPPPVVKDTDRPPAAMIPVTSWTGDIVRFHAFFPKETLTPYPDAIANPELIRFQLSKITAKALLPPDFSRQGYALYRGQTFNYRQDRMMQLTYASKTEAPLTLYALPASELQDSGVTIQMQGSTKGASWVSDRVRFLLTAEKNEEDLKVLAALAQAQMPKKP